MANTLRSNQWSSETLLRGARSIANQPRAELLATDDPELLQELQVCGALTAGLSDVQHPST